MSKWLSIELSLLLLVSLIAFAGFVSWQNSDNDLTGFATVCGGKTSGVCPTNYQCQQTSQTCVSNSFGRCTKYAPIYGCVLQPKPVIVAPQPTTQDEITQVIKQILDKLNSLNMKDQTLSDQITELNKINQEIRKAFSEKFSQVDNKLSNSQPEYDIRQIENDNKRLKDDLSEAFKQIKLQLDDASFKIKQIENDNTQLKNELPKVIKQIKTELDDASFKIKQIEDDNKRLKNDLSEAFKQIDSRISKLEGKSR